MLCSLSFYSIYRCSKSHTWWYGLLYSDYMSFQSIWNVCELEKKKHLLFCFIYNFWKVFSWIKACYVFRFQISHLLGHTDPYALFCLAKNVPFLLVFRNAFFKVASSLQYTLNSINWRRIWILIYPFIQVQIAYRKNMTSMLHCGTICRSVPVSLDVCQCSDWKKYGSDANLAFVCNVISQIVGKRYDWISLRRFPIWWKGCYGIRNTKCRDAVRDEDVRASTVGAFSSKIPFPPSFQKHQANRVQWLLELVKNWAPVG